jgi:ankyrin repeat protein
VRTHQEGNTVLHHAIEDEQMELIKLLMVCGASSTTMNARFETPLQMAMKSQNLTIRTLFLGDKSDVQQRLLLAPSMLIRRG